MSAAVPFPLPPGRVLSAWRHDLAAHRPHRLRLAHLLLHRVEALVRVARRVAVEPFRAALLRQLDEAAPLERLGLDRELLGRWVRELTAEGLVEPDGRRLTGLGRLALDAGAYTAPVEERRAFTFLDGDGRPPCYLALHGHAAPLAPPPGWRFDAAALGECVRRPDEWKARHGFPEDVEAFLAPAEAPDDWRRVILDRPEKILIVFIPSDEAGAPAWLGFAVRAEDWVLQTKAPAVTLGGPEEALPELGGEPVPEAWRDAWRIWCRQRGLPAVDAVRVEPADDHVRAVVPRPFREQLAGERTDTWLLAGAGRVRVAAPLEIVEE